MTSITLNFGKNKKPETIAIPPNLASRLRLVAKCNGVSLPRMARLALVYLTAENHTHLVPQKLTERSEDASHMRYLRKTNPELAPIFRRQLKKR